MSVEEFGDVRLFRFNKIIWTIPSFTLLSQKKYTRIWSPLFVYSVCDVKCGIPSFSVPIGFIKLIFQSRGDKEPSVISVRFGIADSGNSQILCCAGEWVTNRYYFGGGYFTVPKFVSEQILNLNQHSSKENPQFRLFCEAVNSQHCQVVNASSETDSACAAKNEEVKSPVNKGSECLSIPNKETHKNDIDDFITAENGAVKSPVNKGNEYLSIPKKETHKNDIDDFIRAEIDALKLSVNKGSDDDSIYRKATDKNDTDDFIKDKKAEESSVSNEIADKMTLIRKSKYETYYEIPFDDVMRKKNVHGNTATLGEKNEVEDVSEKEENECISTRQWSGKTHEVPITDFITKRKRNRRKGKERKFPGEKNETVKPLVKKESEDIFLNKCKNERQGHSNDDFIREKNETVKPLVNKESEDIFLNKCKNEIQGDSTDAFIREKNETVKPSINKEREDMLLNKCKNERQGDSTDAFIKEKSEAENKEKESDVIVDCNNKSNEVQINNSKILEETSTSFSFGQLKPTERPSTCFRFGLPKPIEKPSTAFNIRAPKLTVLEEMSTGFSFGKPKPTEEKAAENKEKESDVIVDSNNKSDKVQIYNSKKNKATKPYVKKYTEDDVIVNYETEANKFHLPKLKLNDADINVSMEEQNEVVLGSNVSDRVKHARLTDLQISYSTIKAFADKEIEDILQGNSIPSVETCVRCIRNLEKLSQSFRELYTGNKNSDITIKVKYREFKAHKAILRTRSSVFDTMLSLDESATTNDVISIDDCEPDIFDNFLLFIYTGKLENVSSDNLFELYYMAERYAVKDLKNECVYFFKKSLSIETICDMLCLSTKYSETELLQSALRFFAMNLEEVVNTQQWRLLLKENPIKANDLYINALKLGYTKKSRLKI